MRWPFALFFNFNRSPFSVWIAIKHVTSILVSKQAESIKWPSAIDAPLVAAQFQRNSNFPGVIGVLDGCHIAISAPNNCTADYINRNGGFQ